MCLLAPVPDQSGRHGCKGRHGEEMSAWGRGNLKKIIKEEPLKNPGHLNPESFRVARFLIEDLHTLYSGVGGGVGGVVLVWWGFGPAETALV